MVDGEIKAFALNDEVLAYNRTGKDGESATVIINRSLRNSHRVTIPALGECASDVIGGHECEIHNGTVTLDLYPLGSSIIYHHAEQRLQEPLDHGAGVVCHITSVPTDDGKPGTIGAPMR
ncbi:MAG: 4-alpha-glucanotransferase, partial [Collinsella sp.]